MGTISGDVKLSGATLKAWRERMGYSVADAMEQLGCSRNGWNSWEAGDSPVPRYIGLACAALALGMTPYGELPKEERGS